MSLNTKPVKSKKQARDLKFRLYVEKILYYPSSENKRADLRLCFRIGKNPVFSSLSSNDKMPSVVGIFTFTSRINLSLCLAEHEKVL